MTTFRRGDVVLVRFPYADLMGSGLRPALIVLSDQVRTELGHCLIVQITSTPRVGPSRIAIAAESSTGKAMGLRMNSVMLVDIIQTVEFSMVERLIGRCPSMDEVDSVLRLVLNL